MNVDPLVVVHIYHATAHERLLNQVVGLETYLGQTEISRLVAQRHLITLIDTPLVSIRL